MRHGWKQRVSCLQSSSLPIDLGAQLIELGSGKTDKPLARQVALVLEAQCCCTSHMLTRVLGSEKTFRWERLCKSSAGVSQGGRCCVRCTPHLLLASNCDFAACPPGVGGSGGCVQGTVSGQVNTNVACLCRHFDLPSASLLHSKCPCGPRYRTL